MTTTNETIKTDYVTALRTVLDAAADAVIDPQDAGADADLGAERERQVAILGWCAEFATTHGADLAFLPPCKGASAVPELAMQHVVVGDGPQACLLFAADLSDREDDTAPDDMDSSAGVEWRERRRAEEVVRHLAVEYAPRMVSRPPSP